MQSNKIKIMFTTKDRFTPTEKEELEGVITKNAVTCSVCSSPTDRFINYFQCQKNPNHLGDLFVGIFSDLTFPK